MQRVCDFLIYLMKNSTCRRNCKGIANASVVFTYFADNHLMEATLKTLADRTLKFTHTIRNTIYFL